MISRRRYLFAVTFLAAITAISDRVGFAQSVAKSGEGHAIHLTSQKITLPFGTAVFAGGDAAKLANSRCLLCHSRDMIDLQPSLTRETWQKEVDKMRNVYGCPLRADQSAALAEFISQAPGSR